MKKLIYTIATLCALVGIVLAATHPTVGLVWSSSSDPTAGGGVCGAPLWQFLIRTDSPSIYYKSGASCTAWTLLGAGGPSGISGSGTANRGMKWSAATSATNAGFTDDATTIAVIGGVTSNEPALQVTGNTGHNAIHMKAYNAASDASALRWLDSTGTFKWSLGNNSPVGSVLHDFWLFDNVNSNYYLYLDSTVGGTSNFLRLGSTNARLAYNDSTHIMTLQTNGSSRMTVGDTAIATSVPMGINTAPSYQMDVRGTSAASKVHFANTTLDDGGYLVSAQASQAAMAGGMSYDGTQYIAKNATVGAIDVVGGELLFYGATGQTPGNAATATTKMKVYAAGGLELSNSTSATVSAASTVKFRAGTSGVPQMSFNAGAYVPIASQAAAVNNIPKSSSTTTGAMVASLLADSSTSLTYNTNKFTVAASTGDTVIAGTLGTSGTATVSQLVVNNGSTLTGNFNASSGTMSQQLTLNGTPTGLLMGAGAGIVVNTNKFTVDGTSGNTSVGGTLGVTGAVTTNANSTFGDGNTRLHTFSGHISSGNNTNPSAGSCGTSPGTPNGADFAFRAATSFDSTACTWTFSRTWTAIPICVVRTEGSATLPVCTVSATAITCTTVAASTTYHWHCIGGNGST